MVLSCFALRRPLLKLINFKLKSPWPRAPVVFRFSSAKAIHYTREKKHRETLTSMSAIYCFCLFFSSSLLTLLCRLSTICAHGWLKLRSRWRNRRANGVDEIRELEWSAATSITSEFKDEFSQQNWCPFACLQLHFWAVNSDTKCSEIIQMDNIVALQSVNIDFQRRVRAQNRS